MSKSEEYRQELSDRKNNILNLLRETEEYFAAYDEERAAAVRQWEEDLSEEEFTIVVVGEFSTGKSTFLNAMMHNDYLPHGDLVTTATVNFLKHIKKAPEGHTLWVYYNDPERPSEVLEINEKSLKDFVTAQSNIDVSKLINRVELYLDSKFLEDNVTLVDSPGLNALAEGHKEITESQIKKSHACIFLFDKATEAQFNFLRNLQDSIERVFILRNRIDEIAENQIEAVIEDLKKSYSKVFPNSKIPAVYGLSAKLALEARTNKDLSVPDRQKKLQDSRIEEFEARLWDFLTHGEKTLEIMTSPVRKTLRELESYQSYLAKEKAFLSEVNDTADLQKEIDNLEEEKDDLTAKHDQQRQGVLQMLQLKQQEFTIAIENLRERIENRFSQEIDEWEGLKDLDVEVQDFENRLTRDYQRGIESAIQNMKEVIFQEAVTMVSGNLEALSSNMTADSHISFSDLPQTDIQNIIKEHGIEEYKAERERREAELNKLAAEEEQAADNIFRARKLQRQRDAIEADIRELNGKIEHLQSPDYPLPTIHREEVEERETRDRRGLIGKIAQYLDGQKEFVVKKLVVDDSHYKAALAERAAKIGSLEEQQRELRGRLEGLPENGGDYEIKQKRLAQQIREKQREHDQFVQEFKERFQQENARSLKKLKRRLRDHLDDVSSELKKRLTKHFEEIRQQQAAIITDQIAATTNKLIEKKTQQIQKLQEVVQASDAEKNQKMTAIEEQFEKIRPLLKNAIALDSELDLLRVTE